MAHDTVDLPHSARKIMLDGFLLEWNTTVARPWGSDTSWQWSAMATPEGPAGYLMTPEISVAGGMTLVFDGPMLKQPVEVHLPADTALKSDLIDIDITSVNSMRMVVIEWLFPWPVSGTETKKPVLVAIKGASADGRALPQLLLQCAEAPKRSHVWGGVTGKGVLIGLLVLLYLFVQRKLKHQTGRKESPRRSA